MFFFSDSSAFLLLFVFCFFISFFLAQFETFGKMRNIFHRQAFLNHHTRVIKSALVISLQARSQEFLGAESFGKLGYNIFKIL